MKENNTEIEKRMEELQQNFLKESKMISDKGLQLRSEAKEIRRNYIKAKREGKSLGKGLSKKEMK